MKRLHGLTHDELSKIGDPGALANAIHAELADFWMMFTGDYNEPNADDDIKARVEARLALLPDALPAVGRKRPAPNPTKVAIKQTYDLLMKVIEGGTSTHRSDDEMRHWIEAFRPAMGEPAE
jgi:hypothetical protein